MKISAIVTLKKEVLDPQGKVVNQTLKNMGYKNINNVRQGKYFEIEIDETNEKNAKNTMEEICKKLLANSIIEDFTINLKNRDIIYHRQNNELDWKITLVDTGLNTLTAHEKRFDPYNYFPVNISNNKPIPNVNFEGLNREKKNSSSARKALKGMGHGVFPPIQETLRPILLIDYCLWSEELEIGKIYTNDDLLEDYAFALVPFSTKNNSLLNFFYTENNYGDKYLKVESPPPRSVVFLS